jgi:lipoprotein-anchoring transpeptidase ErfK/SrfK
MVTFRNATFRPLGGSYRAMPALSALISHKPLFRVPRRKPRSQSEIVMRTLSAFLVAASLSILSTSAFANILVTVDKSTQRMTVSEDGRVLYNWPVSTGKTGYATPSGSFRAFRMEADHFSKEWDDAPMPYSIFFTKVGHAIHGTYSKNIGMPVSHGCVRLSVAHAAKLYAMVQKEGVLKTKVVLTGSEQVALKRNHRTMTAKRVISAPPQQPQYREQQPLETVSPSPYGEPRYTDRGYAADPQYAERRYGEPRYVYPDSGYGDREYRPQPQYMRPYDPYRNRF